jgi:MFS family permease
MSAPESEPESRNPFGSRPFVRWWAAGVVAGTGAGIQSVTVPLFLRDRVDEDWRALAIAGALITQNLPGAVLALLGGTFADRVEPRRILSVTYSVAAIVALCYVALSLNPSLPIWLVYPLAAVVGSAAAFTNPTRQSMLPLLVSGRQLQNGVIFGTMGFMATFQTLGPSVGGLLTDSFGLPTAFSAEVLLLALGGLIFSRIRTGTPPPSSQSVMSDLREGLRYARRTPAIRGLLLLSTVPGIVFIGPFNVTLPLVVPDVLHASDKWVGLLWGCFGGGVLAGSLYLTWRPLPRRGLAICLSTIAGGITMIIFGLSESLPLSAIMLVVWGLGASVFINYAVALLQQHADPAMMGRVMSMYTLAFFAAAPLGYAQAGLMTSQLGSQATLLSSGACAIVIGVVTAARLHSVRALE